MVGIEQEGVGEASWTVVGLSGLRLVPAAVALEGGPWPTAGLKQPPMLRARLPIPYQLLARFPAMRPHSPPWQPQMQGWRSQPYRNDYRQRHVRRRRPLRAKRCGCGGGNSGVLQRPLQAIGRPLPAPTERTYCRLEAEGQQHQGQGEIDRQTGHGGWWRCDVNRLLAEERR